MLGNIKSSFFTRILFLYLDEHRKLELIKYNKYYQNDLGISIINYINFTGNHILYNEKGIAKELDGVDRLIFEGEYLNGKRNGKGKEYYSGTRMKFEGEYINGKKFRGKEFDRQKNLLFEGEYLNGKKWNGNLFDKKGNIINEIKNGKGFLKVYETFDEIFDVIFEGNYLNGEINGKGKEYFDNGVLIFEGEYLNIYKRI